MPNWSKLIGQKRQNLFLVGIVVLALLFRLWSLNWDQSQHLHPDERFLTMVVSEIKLPSSFSNYFDSQNSTLNPYNHNFNFYVYGTFPLLATRFLGEFLKATGYNQIFLVGRFLSVIFETLTVILVYLLSSTIFKKRKIALWSTLFYALAIFPIQQAHFFTVDSFTIFFSTLTLLLTVLFLEKKSLAWLVAVGFSFGLLLANKTSVGITLPIFLLVISLAQPRPKRAAEWRQFLTTAASRVFLFGLSSFLAFRIFQPYAFEGIFTLISHFRQNISDAHKMITGEIDYPPNIQWSYTKPLLHPFTNLFIWGLGPLTTTLAFFGIASSLKKTAKELLGKIIFLLAFSAVIFFYQGIQLAKYMRYFYPLYPVLAVFAGSGFVYLLDFLKQKGGKLTLAVSGGIIVLNLLFTLAFLSIYSRPHSRITSSEWIYQNIPQGAVLTAEEWDDSLPLRLPGQNSQYPHLSLGLYNQETLEKWQKITQQLKKADYIILSSNRLYVSIPKLPERYPVTSLYYRLLFAEKLGFAKVAEIGSYPCFPPTTQPLFCFYDDGAEESFTVYDHPKVFIFKKENFRPELLQPLLDSSLINQARYLNPAKTNKLF